jgi:S-sulfo-L-cysteine synthase (O-acetyl-L-serine-dependent)
MDLLSAIGNTPLLPLERVAGPLPGVEIYAKAEFTNPGGSVKDRPARAMILAGLAAGQLRPGKTILEATSGNTGIADAMIGAALGYPVLLCVPSHVTRERKQILAAYGARIEFTDPLEGTDGAIRKAREMAGNDPERFFYPDQYSNDHNWKAHYETTGPEIWQATGGRITHFFAGLGTTGTFMGVTRYLKSKNPKIQCVSMQPDGPVHGLEGMKHMASAMKPPIYDEKLADRNVAMSTEEAYAMTRRLAREEGIFVGVSAGGNVAGALRLAERLPGDSSAVVVTILCDGGAKYLSEPFWEKT